MPCKKSLTIFCAYRPPSSSALWLNVFHAVLSQLSVVYHSVLMLDDFNFDLLKSSEFCDDMYQSWNLKQLICSPTRITNFTSKLIDHICISESVNVCASGTTNLHLADHHATFCCIDPILNILPTTQRHRTTCHRSFKDLNNDKLLNNLKTID